MIEIKNLTKKYKTKKKNSCKALNDINLTLPNSGLIFVLGKSGSGKSTLLNLIGGLDNITKGSITVDGNDISSFKERQYCNYRNTHIGFIFQDYHLIDELTVYDNIVLSLNLRRIEDKNLVINALKKVDLENYENRYPNELSGGERQRVAIARAIVKSPRIILADEPNGNLDSVTSKQIIELLKTLSDQCLVLIVSHNKNDAYKYGDRIIELSKGNIIKDISKNSDYKDDIFIHDNNIYYPSDTILNDKDIELINSNKDKPIIKVNDKYQNTIIKDIKTEKIEIENKKLSIKNSIKLSLNFLKNKIFRILLSSFITSAILVILSLSLTIIFFDSGEIIKKELSSMNSKDIVYVKDISKDITKEYSKSHICEIEDGDIEDIINTGYNGNIYKLYSPALYITNTAFSYGIKQNVIASKSIYVSTSKGTLVCNEEFVKDRFEKFNLLAENKTYEKYGFYITDYIADSLILYKSKYKTYDDLLGPYVPVQACYGYINGVIETNYKEKFSSIIETINHLNEKEFKEYCRSAEYQEFYDYVLNYLAISYSFEPDFIEHFNESCQYNWAGALGMMNFHKDGKVYENTNGYFVADGYNNLKKDLEYNECVFTISQYNSIFNTNYTANNLDTFVPHSITIDFYRNGDTNKQNKRMTIELFIKELIPFHASTIALVSKELFSDLSQHNNICYSLYLDGVNEIDSLTEVMQKNGYGLSSYIASGLYTMTKAVDVFIPIFRLIAIVLCLGIIMILTNFSIKMIKDKYHDIGILKALGTQNKSIGNIFGIQIFMIAILTILMSILGYYFFIDLANGVLISSLKELAPNYVVLDLDFLTFKFHVVYINIILILVLCIISLFLPLIKIKNIKPVKIIKTNE